MRLIFSNALKYNARLKEVDSESGRVSQRAYDSALHMAGKLEVAITRMLLVISDRIEREKIEKSIMHQLDINHLLYFYCLNVMGSFSEIEKSIHAE